MAARRSRAARVGRSCSLLDRLVVCDLGRTGGEVWLAVDGLFVPHAELLHRFAGMALAILKLFAAMAAYESTYHRYLRVDPY